MESPFAELRLRTDAAKRFKRVDRAIAVIRKMLMVAESRFRRLKVPSSLRMDWRAVLPLMSHKQGAIARCPAGLRPITSGLRNPINPSE